MLGYGLKMTLASRTELNGRPRQPGPSFAPTFLIRAEPAGRDRTQAASRPYFGQNQRRICIRAGDPGPDDTIYEMTGSPGPHVEGRGSGTAPVLASPVDRDRVV